MLSSWISATEAAHCENHVHRHDALGVAADRNWIREDFLTADGLSISARLAGSAHCSWQHVSLVNVVHTTVSIVTLMAHDLVR